MPPVIADHPPLAAAAVPGWHSGWRDALPLCVGYWPVAMSFGLMAVQSGLDVWQATLVSALVYAGASQFLLLAMVAAGASEWLVVTMTLLVNARHIAYGPTLAPWLDQRRVWFWLSFGLTDQVFALAHNRLPALAVDQRLGWLGGASVLAWASWVAGTAFGAAAGVGLMEQWPALGQSMAFALPALMLALVAPRFDSWRAAALLLVTIMLAVVLRLLGYTQLAIPVAALAGTLLFVLLPEPRHA